MPDARTGKQARTKRADEADPSASSAARTDPDDSGLVLVALDAPEHRAAVARRLRRAGFQVSTAEAVRAAYEAACRARPGLVVSDTHAHGAAELCRLLRADARLRDTPVLFLGDEHPDRQDDEAADEAAALRAGADAFLPASADSLLLVAVAARLLERARASDYYRDLIEREAESDKMRSLGQLSAGVAHNFNNALAAILGRTQLLLRAATNERQRHSLQVIETAARDAAEMVRRIQTFARRAPSAAQFEAVPLAHLVNDAVQLTRTRWQHDAEAGGINYDVRFDAGASADEQVAAQSSELREVFVNLIFNALDAMPTGGVIEVRQQRAGDQLVVRVSDTGSGVSPELRERIFEPFFSTKGALGTGLGLAVSYGIITRHGGSIEAGANETGAASGATFTLRFPRLDATTAETEHKK